MLYTHRSEGRLRDGRSMTVRFKTPADRHAWRRFVALVPDEAGHRPGTQLDPADLTTDYHRYDGPYLLAEVEGEIVGAVFVVPPDPVLGYHRDHVIEFHVDVLPGWRRQGVATALVENLVEWARVKGDVRKLEAACLGWNEPVIAMLKGAGFTEEGRSERSWMVRLEGSGTEYDDVVHMGLWIGK
ncbi:MAG: GNAT family N-acetyltransferase [Thermoplasmata archaeon]|nr:GNAT family N-acetyltransferase [Thermoplasmata archaeon]NIV77299.1 GNAT family N-acetyltransferase [Thermoplasmata archaeon]NIW81124.1 GNAT family N-acetyltransferase [Thermoplasmata archaeon]